MRYVVLVGLVSAIVTASQRPSIPERVQKYGAREVAIVREFSPVELPELVRSADLVLEGVVVGKKSYLTVDQMEIMTDYSIQTQRLWKRSAPLKIELGQTITVNRPGGTLPIKDQLFVARENDFPEFELGEEYVLFLRKDPTTDRYIVPDGAQGAFRIQHGTIWQVSEDTGTWNKDHGKMALEGFQEHLAGAMGAQR